LYVPPKVFQHRIFSACAESPRHIVLPEGEDPRVLAAAEEVVRRKLATITLLGNPEKIASLATRLKLNIELPGMSILEPTASPRFDDYVAELVKVRGKREKTVGLEGRREENGGNVEDTYPVSHRLP
jgi:phosphate acetyltransferase